MVLTDTHTHLYYEKDGVKRAELMKRCFSNNVERLFLPNVDSESIELVMGLANEYPQYCFPMLGLHPCDVKDGFEKELDLIYNAISQYKIYAVGEIGIDLYWDKSTLEIQRKAFKMQIDWAKSLGLPIVIHSRDSFDEVYEILVENKDERLRGIFHCFSGNLEQANKIINLGFYLGIGGVVTYKNSGLDKVVSEVDMKHLVLETDSPYLTPAPFRGKPNESSYLTYIAAKIAELKNTNIAEIAKITTENSKDIFNI